MIVFLKFGLVFIGALNKEILSSAEGDLIEMHFFGSDKSCLITNPGSESFKYVVMPLLI